MVKVVENTKYHVWLYVRFTRIEQHVLELYRLISENPGHDLYDIYIVGIETGQDALLTPKNNTFHYTAKIHDEFERILGHGAVAAMLVERKTSVQLDSPIEQAFWDEWYSAGPFAQSIHDIVPQYPIGNYRVDFAHLQTKTAIELDGQATHSSPDAIAYDRKRQRDIESQGWHVIRFGGKEVYSNVHQCVVEAWELIGKRYRRKDHTEW